VPGLQLLETTKKLGSIALAENISKRRKRKGWNQEDLAHKVGTHVNTIKNIERGASEGALDVRIAIARSLECPLSELYRAEFESSGSSLSDAWKILQAFEIAKPHVRSKVLVDLGLMTASLEDAEQVLHAADALVQPKRAKRKSNK
jgi:transcriptional regulator with XRE-family HTH domain